MDCSEILHQHMSDLAKMQENVIQQMTQLIPSIDVLKKNIITEKQETENTLNVHSKLITNLLTELNASRKRKNNGSVEGDLIPPSKKEKLDHHGMENTQLATKQYKSLFLDHSKKYSDNGFDLLKNLNISEFKSLSELANQGNPQALYDLGNCYRLGFHIEKSNALAFNCMLYSALNNFVLAQWTLGDYFGLYPEMISHLSIGDNLCKKEAFKWYTVAAKAGLSNAQFSLGQMYSKETSLPKGVNVSSKKTFYWYNLAAEQQLAEAQYALANCYLHNIGVPKDLVNLRFKNAFEFCALAREQNFNEAKKNFSKFEEANNNWKKEHSNSKANTNNNNNANANLNIQFKDIKLKQIDLGQEMTGLTWTAPSSLEKSNNSMPMFDSHKLSPQKGNQIKAKTAKLSTQMLMIQQSLGKIESLKKEVETLKKSAALPIDTKEIETLGTKSTTAMETTQAAIPDIKSSLISFQQKLETLIDNYIKTQEKHLKLNSTIKAILFAAEGVDAQDPDNPKESQFESHNNASTIQNGMSQNSNAMEIESPKR